MTVRRVFELVSFVLAPIAFVSIWYCATGIVMAESLVRSPETLAEDVLLWSGGVLVCALTFIASGLLLVRAHKGRFVFLGCSSTFLASVAGYFGFWFAWRTAAYHSSHELRTATLFFWVSFAATVSFSGYALRQIIGAFRGPRHTT